MPLLAVTSEASRSGRAPRDRGLDSGLLGPRWGRDPVRGQEGDRGRGVLHREGVRSLAQEARVPRRRAHGRPHPRPWQHRTHFYGHYANRVGGAQNSEDVESQRPEEERPSKRRCSPSWARLISKVYQADPLVCKRLRRSAQDRGLHHRRALDQAHPRPLGLSPPEEKPPPETREVVRAPVDDEGREIEAR